MCVKSCNGLIYFLVCVQGSSQKKIKEGAGFEIKA